MNLKTNILPSHLDYGQKHVSDGYMSSVTNNTAPTDLCDGTDWWRFVHDSDP